MRLADISEANAIVSYIFTFSASCDVLSVTKYRNVPMSNTRGE